MALNPDAELVDELMELVKDCQAITRSALDRGEADVRWWSRHAYFLMAAWVPAFLLGLWIGVTR